MNAPAEITLGSITARIGRDGMVVLDRRGAPEAGASRRQMLWGREDVQQAYRAALSRKGQEASDEAKALRWADEQLSAARGA